DCIDLPLVSLRRVNWPCRTRKRVTKLREPDIQSIELVKGMAGRLNWNDQAQMRKNMTYLIAFIMPLSRPVIQSKMTRQNVNESSEWQQQFNQIEKGRE